MFKSNTIIPISHKIKENKVYMLNVTTKELYFHHQSLSVTSMDGGMVGVALLLIATGVSRQVRQYLYIDDSSQLFKAVLIEIGILFGFFIFYLVRKKKYEPQMNDYLQEHPDARKIENISELMDEAHNKAFMIIIFTIIILIATVCVYNRFLNNYNLVSYMLGTLLFTFFCISLLACKNGIFVIRMVSKNESEEMDEKKDFFIEMDERNHLNIMNQEEKKASNFADIDGQDEESNV